MEDLNLSTTYDSIVEFNHGTGHDNDYSNMDTMKSHHSHGHKEDAPLVLFVDSGDDHHSPKPNIPTAPENTSVSSINDVDEIVILATDDTDGTPTDTGDNGSSSAETTQLTSGIDLDRNNSEDGVGMMCLYCIVQCCDCTIM